MKKRVFMLTMALGLLLSMCASAWATSYMLSNTVGGYTIKYNVSSEGSTFKIPVQAQVAISSRTNLTGYVEGVDGVKIEYTATPAASFQDLQIAKDKDGTGAAEGSITISITDTTPETYPYNAYLIGTAKGNGTITVKSTLMSASTVKQASNTTATITFSTSQGDDVVDPNFMSDGPNEDVPVVRPSPVAGTPGDPDSDKWDGKDPTFGTLGGNNKDKPKVATSKLVFNGTGGSKGKYATTDKALKSGVSADFEIEIQGPGPRIDVYVAAKDAKKLWPLICDKKYNGTNADWTTDIRLTKANIKQWGIPFRVTSYDVKTTASQDKNTKHKLTIAYNGAEVAYKGFPLTIAVSNDKTNGKAVTKTYKIDITSGRQVPQWVTAMGVVGEKLSKKNAQEISVPLASGGNVGTVIYTVSADGPYYITSKGDKMGVSADVVQPVLNAFGEVTTAGYVKLYGKFNDGDKGTKGGTKESKVAFTLDAVGNVKKTSFKPTVIGKVSPYFDLKDFVTSKDNSYAGLPNDFEDYAYYKAKTAEAGKVPSVKFSAKGSKTITYRLANDSYAEQLAKVGLSFDSKKGQVVQLTNGSAKVPTKATSDDDGEYEPIEIEVIADNGTGTTASATALVGVTGEKAKVFLGKGSDNKEIKNLVIPVDAAEGTLFTIGAKVGKAQDMTLSSDKTVNVHFRLADAKNAKEGREELDVGEDTYKLQGLGLTFIPSSEFEEEDDIGDIEFKDYYRNLGVIKATGEQTATKGTKVNLIVSNLGNEQKGSLTIVIQDPTPVIGPGTATDVYIYSADTTDTVVELKLTAGAPSNAAKINWKFASEGDNKSELKTKKLAAVKEGSTTYYDQATLTLRAKPTAKSVTNVMTITAENAESKLKSDPYTVRVHINEAKPVDSEGDSTGDTTSAKVNLAKNGGAAPASEAEEPAADEPEAAETDDDAEVEEPVVLGAPRTAAQLTAGQNAFLAEKGYKVVAVLPEVTAKVDGQQEFEVELSEDAPEGAKLIWLAFPQNAEETDDDKIADFYDADGTEIEEVPAGKVIIAEPWLRAGVRYQPVIAVEE